MVLQQSIYMSAVPFFKARYNIIMAPRGKSWKCCTGKADIHIMIVAPSWCHFCYKAPR